MGLDMLFFHSPFSIVCTKLLEFCFEASDYSPTIGHFQTTPRREVMISIKKIDFTVS